MSTHCNRLTRNAFGWLGSLVAKELDLQLAGCEFNSRPRRCRVASCLHPRASAGRSGLAMAWLTAVWEAAASYVYHDSHCDVQPWAWLHTLPAVPRSTQPSTLHGMVKWVSAFGLSNNNKWRWWMSMVAAIYRQTHSPSRLVWSEGWRPPGAQSAFIKWTGWTLAVTMVMRTAPQTLSLIIIIIIIINDSLSEHKTSKWIVT